MRLDVSRTGTKQIDEWVDLNLRRETTWQSFDCHMEQVVVVLPKVCRIRQILSSVETERLNHRRLWGVGRGQLLVQNSLASKSVIAYNR